MKNIFGAYAPPTGINNIYYAYPIETGKLIIVIGTACVDGISIISINCGSGVSRENLQNDIFAAN
jgi:hypothetical protein